MKLAVLMEINRAFSVIPEKAAIQSFKSLLDSRLRGSDDLVVFL